MEKVIYIKSDPEKYNGKRLTGVPEFLFYMDDLDAVVSAYGKEKTLEMLEQARVKCDYVPKGQLIIYGTGGNIK